MPTASNERFCPNCHRRVPAGDVFCGGCATRLPTGPMEPQTARPSLQEVFAHIRAGEQRPATVLMTDISGFTSLGEAAEPEWLFHLINKVFAELVEVLIAHGAHIDKYVGDEIVALFGVPHARENAVQWALRAALAMRERLTELSAAGQFGGLELELHAGLNVGGVMVGPVGHWAYADYTVIGDTVNVAKRLEDEAPTGEIYVTQAICDAAGDEFAFEPVGELKLSGRQRTVPAFRLLGTAHPSARPPRRFTSIGREAEFARLTQAAREVQDGRQRCLYLLGAVGIGKSHVIDEWCRLEGDRFDQVRVRCRQFGEHFPLLPVIEVVAQLLGLRVESWPPRVAGDVAGAVTARDLSEENRNRLSEALGCLKQSPPQGEQWLQELAAAVSSLLDCCSRDRPLCLVIEDGQWVDDISRAVLTPVLAEQASRRVLALLTSREPPDTWPPASLEAEVLTLSPLPRAAMEQLVMAWSGPAVLTPEMIRAVCDRAQGHPYFARELVQALCRQPDVGADGELRLPNSLHELLLAQLDALELPLRRLTQAAAVAGEPLSYDLLQAALHEEAPLTPALLGQALSEGLLRMGPAADQFVFGPPLLFEAAYRTIPPSRRKALHASLADHLRRRAGVPEGPGVHLAAHHAYLGYGDERALELLLRSAQVYREQYATRQTVRTAGQVLEIIGALADPATRVNERLEALLLTALAHQVLGDLGHAEGTIAEAEALAPTASDDDLVARVGLAAATLHMMQGEIPAAMEAFTAARLALEKLGNEPRVAHALLGSGMCARQLGQDREALELFAEAARRGAEALWVKAAALNNVGVILMSQGRYAEAEIYLTEGLQANEHESDRRGIANCQASLGELCFRRGQLAAALRWLREALELALEIEDANCRMTAAVLLARVQALTDQAASAAELLQTHLPGPVEDSELEMARRAAQCDLLIAHCLGGETCGEPPACEDMPAEHACHNGCIELLCLRLELALLQGDRAAPAALCELLRQRLPDAPDACLHAYAGWLQELSTAGAANLAAVPGDTVYALRARRLVEGLKH